MPLASGVFSNPEAKQRIKTSAIEDLFPASEHPDTALAGLWLYFCGYDEAHALCQDLETPEGCFWHGILHRQEPDASNAAYWFRRVGEHPVYPKILEAASEILARYTAPLKLKNRWDGLAFIDFCEAARHKPGSDSEKAALEIQRAEWQILFDYCARPPQK